MSTFLIVIASTILFGLLVFLNYKIKGSKSIFVKVGTAFFVIALFVGFSLFYGGNIFDILGIDVKSLSSLKSFFGSRIVGVLAIILVYLFAFLKVVCISFKFTYRPIFKKREVAVVLATLVFDIATIPNIVIAGVNPVVFVAPLVVNVSMIGLALIKLVFSFIKNIENRSFRGAKLCKI